MGNPLGWKGLTTCPPLMLLLILRSREGDGLNVLKPEWKQRTNLFFPFPLYFFIIKIQFFLQQLLSAQTSLSLQIPCFLWFILLSLWLWCLVLRLLYLPLGVKFNRINRDFTITLYWILGYTPELGNFEQTIAGKKKDHVLKHWHVATLCVRLFSGTQTNLICKI